MPGRTAPERTLKKWNAWRNWKAFWTFVFLIVGGAQAALTVVVAANTNKPFLRDSWGLGFAIAAAVLAFLVAALGAQARSSAFEIASRELEKSIAAYETDETVTEVELGKAEQTGIELLNRAKPG